METARLSSKGQVTIPISIRRRLGLRAGENVVFFIETTGNVLITSENRLDEVISNIRSSESISVLYRFGEISDESFITPEGFLPKDKRCEILDALIGSVDDPTVTEPLQLDYESPRDWELMDL